MRKSTVFRASVALLVVLTVSESGTDVKKNSGASNTPTHLSLRNCLVHGVVAANTDCTHAVRRNTDFSILSSTNYSYMKDL